eukprot:CAMPEP_0201488116 /NCGR_PEP_ID=MMETSP0151_2-20130828/17042_1 /ASSEMBLY_ACC=CAM_ASM_000257 /TAXON_ID=200890 /ORGANISM="Paramoeba atlantica, Strain 621/1 / CCAP 1560/9" /LENGTH=75 /DNA_ID=CAMNT_0047873347 /DNA_START=1163 /DNA_END=1390 /DNA_ORIENTATION=-
MTGWILHPRQILILLHQLILFLFLRKEFVRKMWVRQLIRKSPSCKGAKNVKGVPEKIVVNATIAKTKRNLEVLED